jgi:hypothetical protein
MNGGPKQLNFNSFRNRQRLFQFNAEIANDRIHFGAAEAR